MYKQACSMIVGVALSASAFSVSAEDNGVLRLLPNNPHDNYQYDGANKDGDCSGAHVGNSFVVGNRSGIVIYYDFTTPGSRWIDYRADIGRSRLWCRVKHDKKNLMDFDDDVDKAGIQVRSHSLKPGYYYYFILEGSKIKLRSKKLKHVVSKEKGNWNYEVE